MAEIFDAFPMSTSILSSFDGSGLHSPPHTVPDAATTSESSTKRHAACDECRTRKLKCSGQRSGCDRCVKQGMVCTYSEQKQMGRPRKRQKTSDERIQQQTPPTPTDHITHIPEDYGLGLGYPMFADPPIDPSLAAIEQEETDFQNICNGPIAQSIRDRAGPETFSQQISRFHTLDSAPLNGSDNLDDQQPQYPLDISKWPDYSTFESLPLPLQSENSDSFLFNSALPLPTDIDNRAMYDPDADKASLSALPTSPSCSCLANLYLTLSTLSTLSAFPVSNQTIETLFSVQRTAQSVIYCPICPRKFQTGSQNLMLGCTLLNILADHWHKIKRASSEELKKGFTPSGLLSGNVEGHKTGFISTREGQAWRKFAQQLIRAYVFGDETVPQPPVHPTCATSVTQNSSQSSTISQSDPSKQEKTIPREHTLLFIIQALQRRQRQWHNFDEPTDEFPDRCTEGYSYHQHSHHEHSHHDHQDSHAPRVNENSDSLNESFSNPSRGPGYCKVHGRTHDTQPEGNNTQDQDQVKTPSRSGSNCSDPNQAVCLMIVKYSLNIVRSLEKD